MSAFGGYGNGTEKRWDNLENKHWNTMERFTKVGHANVLKRRKISNAAPARAPLLSACPLLGVKRTSGEGASMSASDPKADMSGPGLLLCKPTPKPHFASSKSLL